MSVEYAACHPLIPSFGPHGTILIKVTAPIRLIIKLFAKRASEMLRNVLGAIQPASQIH